MKRLYSIALSTFAIGAIVASTSVVGEKPLWQTNLLKPLKTVSEVRKAPTDNWEGPIIYGTVYYTQSENPAEFGFYAMDGKTGKITPVSLEYHVFANGGGVYEDGVYKFIGAGDEDRTPVYYEFDPTNWSMLKRESMPDWGNGAFDETYDPTTGNVYGCFMDEKGYQADFGYIDHSTHTVTRIKRVDNMVYFAIFATPDGKIYTIASDGYLYEINKFNGETKKIGHTGIAPKYNQTATCDLKTGIVYWIACDQSGTTGVYTVDVATGKASVVKTFQNKEGVVGAFIVQTPWSDHAPKSVENLKVNFVDASTSGTVTFNLPTKNVDNIALANDVNWTLVVDNKLIGSGVGNPGQEIVVPCDLGKEGYSRFSVSVSDQQGTGQLAVMKHYVGYDAPAPVEKLSINLSGGNTVDMSWEAPTESHHGGYLDPNDISYRIVRQPGNTVVSSSYKKTTFTQKLSTTKYAVYCYEVSSQSHSKAGDKRVTGYIAVGPGQQIPWSSNFQTQSDANLYVCLPDNEGNSKWNYDSDDKQFVFDGLSESTANQLVTPYLALDANYAYRIDVHASLGEGANKATMNVLAGLTPTASSFNVNATNNLQIETEETTEYTTYIYCPKTDNWHLALEGINGDNVIVSQINVIQGPKASAPAQVESFELVSGLKGANSVDVKFTTPTKTISGSALSSISKVSIFREGTLINTISNPAPGTQLTFTDSEAPSQFVNYEVRVENVSGEGIPVSGKVYVGIDIPVAPDKVALTALQSCMRLNWTAPTQGVNGAYIDSDELTYIVLRSDNNIVARDLKGTTFDDESDFSGAQRFVQYAVYPVSAAGNGMFTMSNAMIAGTPYELPFHERFPGGSLDYRFWEGRASGTSSFYLNNAQGSDGISGCATFAPKAANCESSLVSGKIDLSSVEHPVLTYNFKATCGVDTRIEVVAEYGDNTIKVLDAVDFSQLKGANDWRCRAVDLTDQKGKDYFRLCFTVKAGSDKIGSSIDEIDINNGIECDIAPALSIGRRVKAGESLTASVRVDNFGMKALKAGDYIINLYKAGKIVSSLKGESIEAFGSRDYEMTLTAEPFDDDNVGVFAEVVCAADQNSANNRSNRAVVNVKHSLLPAVEGFEGEMDNDGNVELRWEPIDASNLKETFVNEDCEGYQPFAIDEVGDWTMFDGDGQKTFAISDGNGSYRAFPNAIDPKAFIVFNEPQSGVDMADEFGRVGKWSTHSGEQMFISFQASGAASDDWLISPELSGKAQTVLFYVRSYGSSTHGAETYDLLYSTVGPDHETFMTLRSNIEAPDEWTLVKLAIPEGGKHFAIRCNSIGHFAFMVDDITYSPANFEGVEFIGFNVYRDKVKVNETPLTATNFSEAVSGKSAAYHVTAVYDAGESRPTPMVAFGEASIDDVNNAKTLIRSISGGIVVEGATGEQCAVFTIDGLTVAKVEKLASSTFVSLPSGIYLVNVGRETHKIIVK